MNFAIFILFLSLASKHSLTHVEYSFPSSRWEAKAAHFLTRTISLFQSIRWLRNYLESPAQESSSFFF